MPCVILQLSVWEAHWHNAILLYKQMAQEGETAPVIQKSLSRVSYCNSYTTKNSLLLSQEIDPPHPDKPTQMKVHQQTHPNQMHTHPNNTNPAKTRPALLCALPLHTSSEFETLPCLQQSKSHIPDPKLLSSLGSWA